MRERDPRELKAELVEQADETRRLIARFSEESEAWRTKALLACLKNDQAILEALASVLGAAATPRPVAPQPATPGEFAGVRPTVSGSELAGLVVVEEVEAVRVVRAEPVAEALATEPVVELPRARSIIEEFDNRDHLYDRGLEKLNSWVAGGRGALPFQKRDSHAYLNRGANSEAMIARIESELMGREGFTRRLGKLKVEGLSGDILVYERGSNGGRGEARPT